MATPNKALLIQARDALLSACGGRCNAEYNPCNYKEVADALTAAIDAPEPKGLFIDMIAQHEGLAEELRDLPEPYDQQALEPCPVCGWKAIVPGEPCLMCERNAKMLVPEPEPLTQDRAEALAHRRCKRYRMADDAPYQFDAHTLMEFVRAVKGVT